MAAGNDDHIALRTNRSELQFSLLATQEIQAKVCVATDGTQAMVTLPVRTAALASRPWYARSNSRSGHKLVAVWGSSMGETSGAMPKRLERGEPIDVAPQRWVSPCRSGLSDPM